MSYILEALRKSDQQRQRERGEAPTLHSAQAMATAPKAFAFPLNVLLAVLLVVAGVAIGWLRPWQARPAQPMAEQPQARPVAGGAIPAAPAVGAVHAPSARPSAAAVPTPGPQAPVAPQSGAPSRQEHVSETRAASSAPQEPAGAAEIVKPSRAEVPEVAPPAAETAPEQPAPLLRDLPASVRQEIPKITISFHLYTANAEGRRVMINNVMLRQGETLSSGLKIEQITPDGVVMRYNGHRFKHEVR